MISTCFVTNEIYPVTPGGAGSLIYNLTRVLLERGQTVILLLNVSRAAFSRFTQQEIPLLPNSQSCRAYHLESLCHDFPYQEQDFLSRFQWETVRYDFACRQVYELEKPDRIEFVDYNGPAYAALCAKIAGLSYQTAHLTVRMHGPVELIDRFAMAKPLDFDRYLSYTLERTAFRLAETVLYPTPSFLEAYYPELRKTWFGAAVCSRPVIRVHPERVQPDPQAKIVLFYGRLAAVKGVDRFVDAAVQALRDRPDSKLTFYMVGYDSMEPLDPQAGSYTAAIERRIPADLRQAFKITGHLNWQQLNELLPQVKLAVIPSYFESFSFAAHELHQAGIPLILSDIPAFRDQFEPGLDALFFDGSVRDLSAQIIRLDQDDELRRCLSTRPTPPVSADAEWYLAPVASGWINPPAETHALNLSICILDDGSAAGGLAQTQASLAGAGFASQSTILHPVWVLRRPAAGQGPQQQVRLSGEPYDYCSLSDAPVPSPTLLTTDALLILRAGDEVAPDFIARGLEILARRPQINFVGSWKQIVHADQGWLQTYPFPAMLAVALYESDSVFNRCLMRTPSGQPLGECFDPRAGGLAELAYLWSLDQERSSGVQIPAPLITQRAELPPQVADRERAYLTLQAEHGVRAGELARYLTMLTTGRQSGPANPDGAAPDNRSPTWFPLQAVWADKNGYHLDSAYLFQVENQSIFSHDSWRRKLVRRLSNGGGFSQRLLSALNRIWFFYKSLLHEK